MFVFSVCRQFPQRCHNISAIPSVVTRPLAEPDKRISHTSGSSVNHSESLRPTFSYPRQVRAHWLFTPCIVPMFLLSRSINRGDLHSAGISRFIAIPLRFYRSPSLASASFGCLLLRWQTILGYYPLDPGCFTKNLWDSPMLAWLLHCLRTPRCCLRPRGVGNTLVINALPVSPAPQHKGSAHSQNKTFSGLRGRFRAHTLHLVVLAALYLNIEFRYRLAD